MQTGIDICGTHGRLHYARQLGCTELIDAATLTGAVVVALGQINAGVFCNNDALYEPFLPGSGRQGKKIGACRSMRSIASDSFQYCRHH